MNIELLVLEGPLKGRRFDVPASGLRLGRSSSCPICIADPALSRNHCLFERRDGAVWVTDLASANGTTVNGEPLGADSRALRAGDCVAAGESVVGVVPAGGGWPCGEGDGEPRPVDLGLDAAPAPAPGAFAPRRALLWAAAALAVAAAAWAILAGGGEDGRPATRKLPDEAPPRLYAFAFEKVEASEAGIYRSALAFDGRGVMTVTIDDVPKENRHVAKSQALSADACARLEKIFSSPALYALDRAYVGTPLRANALASCALRVVRGKDVVTVRVENAPEPAAFREVREQLETFAKNELGLWAIQYSAEKLQEMSAEARRIGDAKWRERDAQFGNLAAALAAYDEAIVDLETVNPKPADYEALVKRRREVADALDKVYADQRFLVDRAIKLQDWAAARRELRVLCEVVPDERDPRHAEATARLLDVEARIKKGAR